MKLLTKDLFLLHREEIETLLPLANPIMKVQLYRKHFPDEPTKTVYFKLTMCSKQKLTQHEDIVRSALRKYSKKTLAFRFELLNPNWKQNSAKELKPTL